MVDELYVDYWRCLNPECDKVFRMLHARFSQLKAFLPTESKPVIFACNACNRIAPYTAADLPLQVVRDDRNRITDQKFVETQRAFTVKIKCSADCESGIPVFLLTMKHYDEKAVENDLRQDWKRDVEAVCVKGHPAIVPIQVISVAEV